MPHDPPRPIDETLHDAGPAGPTTSRAARSASLVVALECERPLAPPVRLSLAGIDEVVIGRGPERGHARAAGGRAVLRVDIPNGWMSSTHTRLLRDGAAWRVVDADSKNGTFLDGEPVRDAPLSGGEILEAGRTVFLFFADGGEAGDLAPDGDSTLATVCPAVHATLDRLARIAPTDVPVLVLGETGTGKELAARALHDRSGRGGAFIDVNCGALPDQLLESELFGHRKGAFSGAAEDRTGLVRAADGGTLFLDEIAELPVAAQSALLRVLQEKQVRPVGDHRSVAVDARVVAATLQDLPARVASGEFREDLYARLAGVVLTLPALRDRREDVGLLAGVLLHRHAGAAAASVRFTRAAARALFAYGWPLNVRELEHALRAALVLAGGDEIDLPHLPAPVQAALAAPPPATSAPPAGSRDDTLNRRLVDLLAEHQGNVSAVARAMGKAPMQVYRWLRRFGIEVDGYRR